MTARIRHGRSRYLLQRTAARDIYFSLWTILVILTTCSPVLALHAHEAGQLTVTSAGKAHDLPPDLASEARVHLVATVTYYDPEHKILFLQDQTGGIFVNTNRLYPVHQGDLVELDGRTDASYRTEVALNSTLRVLGRGQTFKAPLSTYQDLVSGRRDCMLATIRGTVRAADVGFHFNAPSVHMDVVTPGGEVEIYVNSPINFDLHSMLDSTVEVTGVAGGSFDAKYQLTGVILYVPDASAIRVLKRPTMQATELPLTDVDDAFQSRSIWDRSRRVRVRGSVTYYKRGYAAVLQSKSKSIYVQTRQTTDLALGEVVDALGFASDIGYSPSLREAAIIKTGGREQIIPQTVNYNQALSGAYSDDLVSISGRLISELHDVASDTIIMDVDGHPVSAYLEDSKPLSKFLLGSRIRVIGICRVMPGNPWQAPYVFHLEMRTPADAQLIANPSWWTTQHLVEIVSVLTFLAFAISTWAMLLRKRVFQQSKRIRRSMDIARERTRILEKISSNQMPEVVLAEICKSVVALLPGTECSYSLLSEKPEAGLVKTEPNASSKFTLFELPLTGPEGEDLGRIVVSSVESHRLTSNELQEVCAILTELATLAIRQSLLYQGLLHHSTHDPLTDLPNRRLADSKLAEALEKVALEGGLLAVVYIDVNRFKQVNDRYGHKVGDLYLQEISARLLSEIRPADTLARIGGDEFLIIAPLASSCDESGLIKARLQACFERAFFVEGESIDGSASFGVACYPLNGTTAEELKRNADHSMYLAKRAVSGAAEVPTDISIITPEEIETALRNDLFRLAYQPQFSAQGRLTGLEVLLRLEDPILGTLSPDAFISVAERSDVILEVGDWVLRRALKDAIRWQLDTGDEMVIAVNVSVHQMTTSGFAASVLSCLKEYAFPPERLEVELVERSLVSGDEVLRQLGRLHESGVRISLDDFGTGQSSLSTLHRLPIDTIKLDRSFILAMDHEPKVLPIVQAITLMATSLGKRIVAEGIEHVGPVSALLKMADMEFQGYLFSWPLPANEIDHLIAGWRSGITMPDAFRAKLSA